MDNLKDSIRIIGFSSFRWLRTTLVIGALLSGPTTLPTAVAGGASDRVSAADDGGTAHSIFPEHVYRQFRAGSGGANAPSGTASPNDLTYHGGPVMRDVVNYVIIWNPPGSTFSSTYQQTIEHYFIDVGGTPFLTINSQYGDSSGTPVPNTCHFGGTWVDTGNVYPHAGTFADPLTKGDIQDEIDRAIAANTTWQPPGLSTMYFVYLGQNIVECKGAGDCFAGPGVPNANANYCAYHSYFGSGPRIFATMPYAASSTVCGNQSNYPNGRDQDLVLSPTSHEQFEAYSDPKLNAWYNTASGNENGDNCAYVYGQVEPDGANFVLNGRRYQLQEEWSNFLPDGCIKRLGSASQPTITGDLNFGTVCRGTTATKEILIQNSGAGDLNLLNIRLSSGAPAAFSLEPLLPTWATIPGGSSVMYKVNCSPSASSSSAGPLTTSLIIDTDEPGYETQSLAASATVGLPNINTAITDTGSFGDVCIGTFKDLYFTINNSGSCDLSVTGISSSSGQFLVPSVVTFPIVVHAGDTTFVPLRFAPTSLGPKTANITVFSSDPTTPTILVAVSGNAPAGSIRVNGSTDFGAVCAGTLAEKSVTLCNVGACDLHVSSVAFVSSCPDFTLVNNPFPATLKPGSCNNFVIRFTPSSCGAKTCTLAITSDDPGSPTITLTVTANTPCSLVDVSPDQCFPATVIQSVGACVSAKAFPILNKGLCPVSITSITITGPYSLLGLPSFPINLQPGHTVGDGALQIAFAPTLLSRDNLGTVSVTYETDPVTHSTTTVTRILNGEGVRTGARVLVINSTSGVPVPLVDKLMIQRITGNRNKSLLNTVDNAMNLAPVTVTPTAPCGPFKYHREYSTVSNPIQLLPGSYQITATATVNGKKVTKAIGFDVTTCTFNPNIVISLP